MHSLDIILPCYNPPENWANNILLTYTSLSAKLKAMYPTIQIGLIVVNDGSSHEISKSDVKKMSLGIEKFSWVDHDFNQGKGSALRTGVHRSRAKYIMITDVDFPYREESMLAVIQRLIDQKVDVVAGVRDASYYKKTPKYRRILSKSFKRIIKLLFNIKITDTQCGLKAFNKKGQIVFLQTRIERYLFDLEFIWLAGQTLNIVPQLVELREGVEFSSMRMKVLMAETINLANLKVRSLFSNRRK